MRRREFLSAGLIGIASAIGGAGKAARADTNNPTNAQINRETAEWRARAIAAFPYQRVEAPGEQAYAMWLQLKAEQRGSPVVLGDDDDVAFLMERFAVAGKDESYLTAAEFEVSVENRLKSARGIKYPRDLFDWIRTSA